MRLCKALKEKIAQEIQALQEKRPGLEQFMAEGPVRRIQVSTHDDPVDRKSKRNEKGGRARNSQPRVRIND
jgi:predicted phage tail protein